MHYWPNPSITKGILKMGEFKGKRPKGVTDDEWAKMVADRLLDKQTLLKCVPKTSKKEVAPKDK